MMMVDTVPGMALELPFPARAEAKIGRSPKPKTSVVSPRSSTKEKKAAAKVGDNAVSVQLTKTKMCAFFERGKCASANCRYAHSASELRLAPNLQKTKLCRAFLSGECNNENCFFAHGETDLRVTEGIYKTQMCNFFERGYCKKGDRCNHAHGAVDLRPSAPPSASTPMGKISPSSQKSSQSRRSPLPLSELLVIDSEANSNYLPQGYNAMPPTPTKSVTELAQLAFSPVHSIPLWSQYGLQTLSPMGALGAVNDMAFMYPPPRDACDLLVQNSQNVSPAANLLYSMDMMESPMASMELPDHSPLKAFTPLCLDPSPLHRPAPGLLEPRGTPPHRAPVFEPLTAPPVMGGPPGLGERVLPRTPGQEDSRRDPLMINLSERLASLDAVTLGLASDIAAIKKDPTKTHRI